MTLNTSMLLKKINGRLLHLFSSGSPTGYIRKSALYALQPFEYMERRKRSLMLLESDESIRKSVNELKKTGCAIVTNDIDPELLKELQTAAADKQRLNPNGNPVINREYFGQTLTTEDFSSKTPFVRFALQEKLLKIIAAYFGHVPKLYTTHLITSKPTPGKNWSESQLWHRDHDDARTIKIFVYLTDVEDDNSGPFTFIPREFSKNVTNDIIPKRVTDDDMTRQGMSKHSISLYGKAGTVFLIDTATCYHMGSRCIDKSRIAFVATFNTIAPLQKNGVQFHDCGNLTDFQKLFFRS